MGHLRPKVPLGLSKELGFRWIFFNRVGYGFLSCVPFSAFPGFHSRYPASALLP